MLSPTILNHAEVRHPGYKYRGFSADSAGEYELNDYLGPRSLTSRTSNQRTLGNVIVLGCSGSNDFDFIFTDYQLRQLDFAPARGSENVSYQWASFRGVITTEFDRT